MPKDYPLPILAFVAYSGTGKTTLLEALLPLLRAQGLRVSYIKHSHHQVDLDQPGKDSYRLRQAGAAQVILASAKRWALMQETADAGHEPDLHTLVNKLDPALCDLVLVEGFKHQALPKIECLRQAHLQQRAAEPIYRHDPQVIALACDRDYREETPIPKLDLNQPTQIARFIIDWLAQQQDQQTASYHEETS
ncbi:MAG: molybdopterin-guanine dinucleotide biosynthesis protein B [Chromatiales bacterium]|nr:molybdopterin-guanine dinucleotide biosynthesis protein B [Gammaproteobacteria bacterium]MBW6477064.1 molybdopterin-guanine dinucleotide biosynthesis protein B [Chromatiales bacterium]